jgi:uncharacterized membrane protein
MGTATLAGAPTLGMQDREGILVWVSQLATKAFASAANLVLLSRARVVDRMRSTLIGWPLKKFNGISVMSCVFEVSCMCWMPIHLMDHVRCSARCGRCCRILKTPCLALARKRMAVRRCSVQAGFMSYESVNDERIGPSGPRLEFRRIEGNMLFLSDTDDPWRVLDVCMLTASMQPSCRMDSSHVWPRTVLLTWSRATNLG